MFIICFVLWRVLYPLAWLVRVFRASSVYISLSIIEPAVDDDRFDTSMVSTPRRRGLVGHIIRSLPPSPAGGSEHASIQITPRCQHLLQRGVCTRVSHPYTAEDDPSYRAGLMVRLARHL